MGERGTGGGRLAGALVGMVAVVAAASALTGVALSGADAARSGEVPRRAPVASPTRTDDGPPVPLVVDLSAQVQLPRLVRQPRTALVRVVNHAAAPVRVREVELRTDSFAPTGPVAKDVVIPAGQTRGLEVVYGEARCEGRVAPSPAPARAWLVVGPVDAPAQDLDDPRWRSVELPLSGEALAQVLRTDCAHARVAEAVELRFGPWTPLPDGRLRGLVVVERRLGDEPVVLHAVAGNILFRIDTADGDLGALAPGQRRLEVPVTADAARCDGHAVGEVKRQHRYQFAAWVSVGEDAQLPTTVAVDDDGADQLEEILRRRCDLG